MTDEDIAKENAAIDRERARDEAREKSLRDAELRHINEVLAARGQEPVTYSSR